ncbi:heterokaryon incompatibility protein-domain-containing protein [Earliella scabrosa]|nr:heterokaryon incompatibility protein-domain-containing protein [Earliella scabrosa]
MRLLDTHTLEFHWIYSPKDELYVILSHVWNREGEQTLQDIQRVSADSLREVETGSSNPAQRGTVHPACTDERVSAKIRDFCAVARASGYRYAWIDTCCIDKASSAELSEAINSMYEWYSLADICYAYLHDVSYDEDPYALNSAFQRSEWFTRGWTLQELIAPAQVAFFSKDWRALDSKHGLAPLIAEITGVDEDVLVHEKRLDSVSVARRMSWAAKRKTTRVEDAAYSLMGLFGINMPTIYGEGRKAFVRLQEEILKRIPDQSIFAWGCAAYENLAADSTIYVPEDDSRDALFAPDPASFRHSHIFSPITVKALGELIGCDSLDLPDHSVTAYGIRLRLPLLSHDHLLLFGNNLIAVAQQSPQSPYVLALLACVDDEGNLVSLVLCPSSAENCQYHVTKVQLTTRYTVLRCRAISLSKTQIRVLAGRLSAEQTDVVADIYICHPGRDPRAMFLWGFDDASYRIFLPPWTVSHIEKTGFSTANPPTRSDPIVLGGRTSIPWERSLALAFKQHDSRHILLSNTVRDRAVLIHIVFCHSAQRLYIDVDVLSDLGAGVTDHCAFGPEWCRAELEARRIPYSTSSYPQLSSALQLLTPCQRWQHRHPLDTSGITNYVMLDDFGVFAFRLKNWRRDPGSPTASVLYALEITLELESAGENPTLPVVAESHSTTVERVSNSRERADSDESDDAPLREQKRRRV